MTKEQQQIYIDFLKDRLAQSNENKSHARDNVAMAFQEGFGTALTRVIKDLEKWMER